MLLNTLVPGAIAFGLILAAAPETPVTAQDSASVPTDEIWIIHVPAGFVVLRPIGFASPCEGTRCNRLGDL